MRQHCPACDKEVPNYVLFQIYCQGKYIFECKCCGSTYGHSSPPAIFYKRFAIIILAFAPLYYYLGEMYIHKVNVWIAIMLWLSVAVTFLAVFVALPKKFRRCPFNLLKDNTVNLKNNSFL